MSNAPMTPAALELKIAVQAAADSVSCAPATASISESPTFASPPPAAPTPTPIFCRLMVHSVDEIDTRRQLWKGDVELESKFILKWSEAWAQKLRGFSVGNSAAPYVEGRRKDANAEQFWGAHFALLLDFKNAADTHLKVQHRDVWCSVTRVGGAGGFFETPSDSDLHEGDLFVVSVCQRVRARFCQRFELADFPFDQQRLRIELLMKDSNFVFASSTDIANTLCFDDVSSPSLSNKLKKLGTQSHFQPAARQSPTTTAWDVFARVPLEVGRSHKNESRSETVYSRARFFVVVNRKATHYLMQLVVPYVVCTLAVFNVAAIDPLSIGERLHVVTELLLTGVGIRFCACVASRPFFFKLAARLLTPPPSFPEDMSNYLPDAASHTLLESYVQACLVFFLVAASGMAIVAKEVLGQCRIEGASDCSPDAVFWGALAAAWVSAHALFTWRACAARRRRVGPSSVPLSQKAAEAAELAAQAARERQLESEGLLYKSLEKDAALSPALSTEVVDEEEPPLSKEAVGFAKEQFQEAHARQKAKPRAPSPLKTHGGQQSVQNSPQPSMRQLN